jgi:hypothetical protein
MSAINSTLLRKLEALPMQRLAEVEDFVEFLTEKESRAGAARRLARTLDALDSSAAGETPTADEIRDEIESSRRTRRSAGRG